MTKITAEHLARGAYVYVVGRQRTSSCTIRKAGVVSTRWPIVRQLGWTTVEVVDEDLGRSGSGISRPGFERLLTAICAGSVGNPAVTRSG